MNLHHDREAFEELIVGAANELRIPANVYRERLFCNSGTQGIIPTFEKYGI